MIVFANTVARALRVANKKHDIWEDVAKDGLSAAPVGPDTPVPHLLKDFCALWLLLLFLTLRCSSSLWSWTLMLSVLWLGTTRGEGCSLGQCGEEKVQEAYLAS